MNYYTKAIKPFNELKYKMQIAGLTLNINKNKSDIISLRDNNLSKISSNKINISSNLEKINDISSNLIKEILIKIILLKSKILVLIKTPIFLIFLK